MNSSPFASVFSKSYSGFEQVNTSIDLQFSRSKEYSRFRGSWDAIDDIRSTLQLADLLDIADKPGGGGGGGL